MELPIALKLKRKAHKKIAYAQDLIVEALYKIFQKAVLHGGTSIWRCYDGNRFSEDIDVYIERDVKKIETFFKNIEEKGFKIIKKRIKQNSIYSVLILDRVEVRFEAIFKKIKNPILKEYSTSDGLLVNIYTLNAAALVKEKIETYLKRRKIRDLYDIFFLLRYIKEKKQIKNELNMLIKNFRSSLDKEILKTLIIQGIVASEKNMLEYIKRWAR